MDELTELLRPDQLRIPVQSRTAYADRAERTVVNEVVDEQPAVRERAAQGLGADRERREALERAPQTPARCGFLGGGSFGDGGRAGSGDALTITRHAHGCPTPHRGGEGAVV